MAMCKQLLLQAGGGVIDTKQLSDQDNCAVLAIGLGGTGTDCLRNLKRKVYNRIEPDDPDSPVVSYSHIQFMSVDADQKAMEGRHDAKFASNADSIGEIDMDTEFFSISYAQSISKRFERTKDQLAQDPAYKEWLRFNSIKAEQADDGAGGIRQLGRFLLFDKAAKFVAEVKNKLTEAMKGLAGASVYVHVFSGLSGGTGSGTFLDVCYLVRYALEQMGVNNARVLGYFFLPDVNLSKPNLPQAVQDYIKFNGYAAMQELDYCMNFGNNGDSWHQVYPTVGPVETNQPPVNKCYLVSGMTSSGDVIADAYDYAMNVVSDYVMDFIAKPSDLKHGIQSHLNNLEAILDTMPGRDTGALYRYLVLGGASAVVPYKEILTYLAARMLASFGPVRVHVPSDGDVDRLCRVRLGLTYQAVCNSLTAGALMHLPVPDWKAGGATQPMVVDFYQRYYTNAQEQFGRNQTSLDQEVPDWGPVAPVEGTNTRSLEAVVLTAVREAMVDPARGPWWAAALIQSATARDLLSAIAGVRQAADEDRAWIDQQYVSNPATGFVDLETRIGQALNEWRNGNVLSRGKGFKKYLNLMKHHYEFLIRKDMDMRVIAMMDALKARLTDMYQQFAVPFCDTVSELFEVFQANATYLTATNAKTSPYEIPIVDMKTMIPKLDAALKAMDLPVQAGRLMDHMLSREGLTGWGPNGDERKLARLLTAYFNTEFNAFTQRSISEYLQDAYNATGQALVSAIRKNLFTRIDAMAQPLYWLELGFGAAGAGTETAYLTVPQISTELVQAAKDLEKASDDITERDTDVRDRISLIRLRVGLPMTAYKGVSQYEQLNFDKPGTHLYEGAEYVDGEKPFDSRNWSTLPSPTPLSRMNDTTRDDRHDRAQEAAALYRDAEMAQVATVDPVSGDVRINVWPDSVMRDVRTEFSQAKEAGNDVKKDAQQHLQALKDNTQPDPVASRRLLSPPDGIADKGTLERKRIDRFVYAPRYQELVRTELAKRQEIDRDIKALEPHVDTDLADFRNALFTGVIMVKGQVVKYEGDFDTEVLSKGNMQYGAMPLFQALESFRGLDDSLRGEIRDKVAEILDAEDLPESVTVACDAIARMVAKDNLRIQYDSAKEDFPDRAREALGICQDIAGHLPRFRNKYGV